jgi:DNA-binding LacI/PurR family transcriptional regulator
VPKHVKLADVARAAGVSAGTASQALNQRTMVSPETRKKVLEVAVRLGYFKDTVKPLHAHELKVIGVLVKQDINLPREINPFFSHIQSGVEQACRDYGMSMMISTIDVESSNRPVAFPIMLKEKHPDGLISLGTFLDGTTGEIFRDLGIPVVLADSYAPGLPFDSVLIDNRQGALSALHHLIEHGHERIGLVGSNQTSPPGILERRWAYLEALKTNGLTPYIEDSDLSREPAYTATTSLIERSQVTAIFACNDDVAIGAMQAVRDMGKRVPEDISVVGFDNIDSSADVYPPLTTVHVHKRWMGMMAVQTLLERARNPDKPKTTTTVSTDLIVRQSVASPKTNILVHKGGQSSRQSVRTLEENIVSQ